MTYSGLAPSNHSGPSENCYRNGCIYSPCYIIVDPLQAQCIVANTTNLYDIDDIASITPCSAFTGNTAIATTYTDELALDGVETIDGSLYVGNVGQLSYSLIARSLSWMLETFTISDSDYLESITMPKLSYIGHGLPLTSSPILFVVTLGGDLLLGEDLTTSALYI